MQQPLAAAFHTVTPPVAAFIVAAPCCDHSPHRSPAATAAAALSSSSQPPSCCCAVHRPPLPLRPPETEETRLPFLFRLCPLPLLICPYALYPSPLSPRPFAPLPFALWPLCPWSILPFPPHCTASLKPSPPPPPPVSPRPFPSSHRHSPQFIRASVHPRAPRPRALFFTSSRPPPSPPPPSLRARVPARPSPPPLFPRRFPRGAHRTRRRTAKALDRTQRCTTPPCAPARCPSLRVSTLPPPASQAPLLPSGAPFWLSATLPRRVESGSCAHRNRQSAPLRER